MKKHTLICPPNYVAQIAGARFVRIFAGDRCEAEKLDGTKVSKVLAVKDRPEDFIDLVNAILA